MKLVLITGVLSLVAACGGSISSSSSATAAPDLTPDTGVTASQCYAAGADSLVSCTGVAAIALSSTQDGMRGRDVTVPDNSDGKLGFSYSTVGSYPKTDCVKDNVTGLIWEGKPASGTRGNPALNPNSTYTNFDSNSGSTEAAINASPNAAGYVNAVNVSGLGGASNWRLPTINELQTIVDYGVASPGPTIDTTWFPNTQGNSYWTSSPRVSAPGTAWFGDFKDGIVNSLGRSNTYAVRLVR